MLKYYFKFILLSVVFIANSTSYAGSYEDFFQAVRQDNPFLVTRLLNRGFDPNSVDENGVPALLLAVQTPALRVIDALLEHPRLKVEVRTPHDESVLMLAALRGYHDVCVKLVARDADINKPGWTPLHYAATGGHTKIVQMLLDVHAYIDAPSPNGSTPLMMAAQYGNTDTVSLLLKAGADPLLRNELGLDAVDFALQVKRQAAADLIRVAIGGRSKQ